MESPETESAPEAHESRELAVLVVQVGERARAQFVAATEGVDLPVPMRRLLLLLDEPKPMRELASQLACDPSYITGLADKLENLGLAERVSGEDRRVKLLAATDGGHRLRSQLAEGLAKHAFARQLSADERQTLRDLLQRLLTT